LLQSTDALLDLADHRIADLWRAARDPVETAASVDLAGEVVFEVWSGL
jgi:hypothetical protein